jgi:endonuclease-3|tara:strand:+ start:585 stop:1250 length:666 start_codon:yes stop_codon:yes gene_type:complete
LKKKEKAEQIVKILEGYYPETPIPLDHNSVFQLLIAVLMSAQTTDKKVNQVTPALFEIAPNAELMSQLDSEKIQSIIREVGLAPTKARNINKLSKMLVELHEGNVPNNFKDLEALPGVGHKTASVVMAQAFNVPAFPVDTHIHRLAARWGLSNGSSVERTERDLKKIFPIELWNKLHLQIIFFGREYCPARFHDLTKCPICSWTATKKRIKQEMKSTSNSK